MNRKARRAQAKLNRSRSAQHGRLSHPAGGKAPSFAEFASMMALAGGGQVKVADLTKAHPRLVRSFRPLDLDATAPLVGGLLLRPELQASCLRLEGLAHLLVRHAASDASCPAASAIATAFEDLGRGRLGMMEDPAEDLFCSSVQTSRGGYRVFEGILEGATFHLQRILDVVDGMPPGILFDRMRDSVHALMALSEVAADRAVVVRYSLGQELPQAVLPAVILDEMGRGAAAVTFTGGELAALGIERAHLEPFVFEPKRCRDLDGEILGHSSLERRPLLACGDGLVLALPTAVSAAVRRFVIEECRRLGLGDNLRFALAASHARLLRHLPILGRATGVSLRFRDAGGVSLASVLVEFDPGRWLHVVAFTDGFDGYDEGGLVGSSGRPDLLEAALMGEIEAAAREVRDQPEFQGGLSLLVGCGWGRSVFFGLGRCPDRWEARGLSAYDLETLSGIPDFGPASLWRVLEMEIDVRRRGLDLLNVNGLINLVAWARSLDEHLVPHADLADRKVSLDEPLTMLIPQNGQRVLRHEVAEAQDRRVLCAVDGEWVMVRRFKGGVGDDHARLPIYGADEDASRGRLRGACETPERTWWAEAEGGGPRGEVYRHWEAVLLWLADSAAVLEADFPTLPPGPVRWIAEFTDLPNGSIGLPEPVGHDELAAAISLAVSPTDATVRVRVGGAFHAALYDVDNTAEVALVRVFVEGIARLAGCEMDGSALDATVARIVRNKQARRLHVMRATGFRDVARQWLNRDYVKISRQDSARVRLGLGWRTRARDEPNAVEGKETCTALLNATVKDLEEEFCRSLKGYGREALIRRTLLNYEAAACNREWWMRTASAVLGLSRDRDGTARDIAERDASRNAVLQASRVLVEAAICECPDLGRIRVGEIDLSRLMAAGSQLVQLGGWSNAIRWDAMEPRLHVSALGDIMSASEFEPGVMTPFGRLITDMRIEQAAEAYPSHFVPAQPADNVDSLFDPRFVAALRSELGFSFEDGRAFADVLDEIGYELNEAVLPLRRSALLERTERAGIAAGVASRLVDGLSLRHRPSWREVPAGFRPRDREPWRFRRRLSLLRRPLVAVEDAPDPLLLVAPGAVREAFIYLVRNLQEGFFDASYADSREMRSWIGAAADRRGHAFNAKVAERMGALGWNAEADLPLKKLLRQGFARDYGDVDVLAWDRSTGRVLVMECKDLLFAKSHGEVAEQIAKFRGEADEHGRPDLLRKHLDRVELLARHIDAVGRYTDLGTGLRLESLLVFRNPVPLQFARERLGDRVRLWLYDELGRL